MTVEMLKVAVSIISLTVLLKLVLTIPRRYAMTLTERLALNIWENSKVLAIVYLVVNEMYMLQIWAITYDIYWSTRATDKAAGIAVIISWIWTIMIAFTAPILAGFKKWINLFVSAIMLTTAAATILTLI